jgi:starch-binding outer membrane protein, SusD/RagB family
MKNITGIILVLAALFTFSGCEDILTDKPESVLSQVNFYTNPTRINLGIIGCYGGMANVSAVEWRFTEFRSDNTCNANTGSGSGERVDLCDIAFFRPSSSMPMIKDYWYRLFQNISNINAVLPSVADNKYVTIEAKRAQYEGELLFMRAYHYFTLVNLFGDMFKVTSVIGPNEAKKIVRSPVSEIYDEIIIPDLIKAANEAPDSYSVTSDKGRITKWAAKAMLAKVYMQKGGADNLALAKPLLQEVMVAPDYGLLTDSVPSKIPYANIFNIANEMNKEIIFAVRFLGGTSGIGSQFWTNFAPDGSANLFLKIGTPDGNNNPTLEIMSLFASDIKDTRSAVSFGKWQKTPTTAIPYIAKYQDATMTQSKQSENDWPVIRYADIVLLYAELLAQDPAGVATAHVEVNKVRARAGVAPLPAFTSTTEALDAVYKERRLELAFENQRWYDLLRMNKSYNDSDKAMSILKTHHFTTDWALLYSKYSPILPPNESFFINDRLLLPIPQTEIDTNNEMVIKNNPSY